MIETKTEQFVILGFVNETSYVDKAHDLVQKQCPNGRIVGISTQHSTSHGFLSWHNKILMRGTCIKA